MGTWRGSSADYAGYDPRTAPPDPQYCPRCGAVAAPGTLVCPRCGAPGLAATPPLVRRSPTSSRRALVTTGVGVGSLALLLRLVAHGLELFGAVSVDTPPDASAVAPMSTAPPPAHLKEATLTIDEIAFADPLYERYTVASEAGDGLTRYAITAVSRQGTQVHQLVLHPHDRGTAGEFLTGLSEATAAGFFPALAPAPRLSEGRTSGGATRLFTGTLPQGTSPEETGGQATALGFGQRGSYVVAVVVSRPGATASTAVAAAQADALVTAMQHKLPG